jgi:2-dehydro-3-deoxygluconokinase
MRAVCIGECMVEMRQEGALYARGFAGDAYNVAVYLKRSFPELAVRFLSATGDDSLSSAMRAAWREEGIDDSLAFTIPGARPGLYLIDLDARGERRFLYWRGESAARQWFAQLEHGRLRAALADADLVYFSGISLAILDAGLQEKAVSFLDELKMHNVRVAFDPNYREALWSDPDRARTVLDLAMRAADTVLPSSEDIATLYGISDADAQLAFLRATGAHDIVVTRGAEGCVLADGSSLSAAAVRAVDTTGAGDAFKGAYLAARLKGAASESAARAGLAVAARVVTSPGAIVPHTISHPKDAP